MADHPIIFSAPMVRALLDGRKTQTRRLARIEPRLCAPMEAEPRPSPWQRVRPGDRLWVREAWKPHSIYADIGSGHVPKSRVFYAAQSGYAPKGRWRPSIHMPRWASRITLTVTAVKVERLQAISEEDAKAEGVLQRIVRCADGQERGLWFGVPHAGAETAVHGFSLLWDSLHNPRGLCRDDAPASWDANPEVVALSFTVERRNIDAEARDG